MRSRRLFVAPALVAVLSLLPGTLLAGPASAARRPPRSASPPPPPPGWVVDRVRFEPVDTDVPLEVVGTGRYRGAIEVAGSGGGVGIVDHVGLDDYLRGIAEVPPTWPAEALKAQVIAARTYALYELGRGSSLCATDACQVYLGMAGEERSGGANWSAAVDATRGQVLLYKGAPILAQYSSSNGGRSVAGSQPYLWSVNDPDDVYSPLHHWHYTIPVAALAAPLGVQAPATLVSVVRAGDTIVLTLQAPDGTQSQTTMPADDFRGRMNHGVGAPAGLPMALPTARFSVSTASDQAVVDGGGWGHGIGMSQYGALGKAVRGLRADAILASYYGGLRPTKLAPQQLPADVPVTLSDGQSTATVTAAGRFRVLDGDGHPLAALAVGRWQVVPASAGRVRVVPPEGYDKPVAVTPRQLDPVQPVPGTPIVVRFTISVPAVVRVRASAPGAGPVATRPQVFDPGDVVVTLPAPPKPGDEQVVIEADAGPGRTVAVPVLFRVAGPTRALIPPPTLIAAPAGPTTFVRRVLDSRHLIELLAVLLLLVSLSSVARVLPRRAS